MKLIALYSPVMGCGKSTAAQYLDEKHSFLRMSFAAPLKGMLYELLTHSMGFDSCDVQEMLHGSDKERPIPGLEPLTTRTLAQTIGTDWGRKLDPDFWVKIMAARLKRCSFDRVVIDDMRFPNEYDLVVKLGGLPVLLIRPGAQATNNHPSEGQLAGKPFSCGIVNGGTIEDLHGSCDMIAARALAQPPSAANFY